MIVKHNKTFVTYVGEIYFYPGNNEFNEEKSKILLASADFNSKVESGMFTVVGAEKATSTAGIVKTGATKITPAASLTISGLNVAKASEVIAGIFNVEELNRLKETDARKGVHEAIDKQLAILQANDENTEETTEETTEEVEE